jgi:hypothetical protein
MPDANGEFMTTASRKLGGIEFPAHRARSEKLSSAFLANSPHKRKKTIGMRPKIVWHSEPLQFSKMELGSEQHLRKLPRFGSNARPAP